MARTRGGAHNTRELVFLPRELLRLVMSDGEPRSLPRPRSCYALSRSWPCPCPYSQLCLPARACAHGGGLLLFRSLSCRRPRRSPRLPFRRTGGGGERNGFEAATAP